MAGSPNSFTLTLSDLGTIAGIFAAVAGLLAWFIRSSLGQVKSDVALELVKSENRIAERVKQQFVEKDMMDVKLKSITEKVENALKKED